MAKFRFQDLAIWQMEENLLKNFKVSYDDNEDMLYLAKESEEEELLRLFQG